MRTILPIKVNQRKELKLEAPGLALQSAFVDDGHPETLVMVYRVDPLPATRGTIMPVVKFSERQFAILNPNANHLQLGTLQYFREYEAAGDGIQDDMEGRFREDVSDTLLRAGGLLVPAGSLSAQATRAVKDQWIFCTSVMPTGIDELGQLGNKFGYECGTQILDPVAFAQELGAVFAAHTSWADVRLSARDKTLQQLTSTGGTKRTVFVYHGPVCYPSEPTKVVYSFPEHHRPAIVPFQKRPDYEWQQEYRFTVTFLGEPQAKTLRLPITTKLLSLASVVWEGSARGKR